MKGTNEDNICTMIKSDLFQKNSWTVKLFDEQI